MEMSQLGPTILLMPEPIRTLDLFAGAGGLSQGLRLADTRFISSVAVELDRAAATTYSLNFPEAEVHADPIEQWLENSAAPDIDVIVGGPPCQGFSALGRQDVDDERNTLWRHYLHAVKRSMPKYFVIENVPQFMESPQFALFRDSIENGELSDYSVQARLLNSADFGAPQARKRVIALGSRRDLSPLRHPARTHVGAHVSVSEALAGVQPRVHKINLPVRPGIEAGGRAVPGPFRLDELHLTRHYQEISLRRFAHIGPGQNRFAIPEELLSPCWRRHRSGSGDVMGRLFPDRPSVTIRTEFFKPEKGRYLHPTEHRAITHYEAGLLQGFAPDSLWAGSKTDIARQIGNAVPLALGAAIGRQIVRAIDGVEGSFDLVDRIERIDVLPEPQNTPASLF